MARTLRNWSLLFRFGLLPVSRQTARNLRAFKNYSLADCACLCISRLIAITAMILYRSQRDHGHSSETARI